MSALPPEILDPSRLRAVAQTGLLDTPPDDGLDRLARLAASLLDAPFAFVTLVDDTRSFWKSAIGLPKEAPRENTVRESFCQYVIAEPGTLMIDDAAGHPLTCANPSIEQMGVGAWAGATLRGPGGEALGSFCVVDSTQRQWTPRDAEVLETLAEAAAASIARTQAQAEVDALRAERSAVLEHELLAERGVTELLQTSLLPTVLASIPGVSIAARYQAADDRATVGGDFYDVFVAGDGSYLALVGDVCGKGPKAAAATAMARWALRSRAVHTSDPAALLTHLREVIGQQPSPFADHEFLTMALVRLTPALGGFELTAAHAGHPASIACGPDHDPVVLDRRGGLIWSREQSPYVPQRTHLPTGSTLVLHSDGLLDAQAPDQQLETEDLVPIVCRTDGGAEAIADALMATAAGSQTIRDDIALLVLSTDDV
ncbi:hypothetical protein DSM112329_03564 [Paraconexibacter sp. AEG42_29]|uniref:Uncharacterized protein n=1 Tax=Paraconexibacter sp. AEG42_29 TaxID=2997339 RepID=A0AAU7AYJ0_9ACTN